MTFAASGGRFKVAGSGVLSTTAPPILSSFPQALDIAVGLRGTTFDLYQQVDSGHWWRCSLEALLRAGESSPVHQVTGQSLVSAPDFATLSNVPALTYVEESDAKVTYTGTWFGPSSGVPGAHGGTYKYSTTAGSTATVTAPTNTASITINAVTTTNGGGVAAITIDGDITRANLLPTAQSLVDAGTYASTILTTNGGTLDPTQKVLTTYSAGLVPSQDMQIADGLDPAVTHTIVYRATGYARVADATSNRAYLSAFAWGAPGNAVALISSEVSNWDTAVNCLPTGGTTTTFVGGTHGYESETSFTLTVDGTPTTLSDLQVVHPTSTAKITRVTTLTHPDISPTKIADVVSVFTLTRAGIELDWTLTWAMGATVTTTYVMMPMPGPTQTGGFDRANLNAWTGGPITLPSNLGTTVYYGGSKSSAVWLWQSTGNLAAIMWCKNALQWSDNWHGPLLLSVENRASALTKAYLSRVSSASATEAVTAGKVWRCRTLYRFGRFANPSAVFGG